MKTAKIEIVCYDLKPFFNNQFSGKKTWIFFLILFMIYENQIAAQWENITNNIPQLPSFVGVDKRNSFVASQQGDLYLYLHNGLYHSDNLGSSWTSILNQPQNQGSLICEDNVLYAVNNKNNLNDTSFFITNDKGITWQKSIRPGGALSYSNALAYINNKLYMALSGSGATSSMFVSQDNGQNWLNYNAPAGQNLLDLVSHGNKLYLSREYYGVYVKVEDDPNSNWTQLSTTGLPLCLGSPCTGKILIHSDKIYMCHNQGVSRFNELTNSWETIFNGNSNILWSKDGYLFLGTNNQGFFYSTDAGVNWTQSNDGFENSLNQNSLKNIRLATHFGEYLFVTTFEGEVFRRKTSDLENENLGITYNPNSALENLLFPNPCAAEKISIAGDNHFMKYAIYSTAGALLLEGLIEHNIINIKNLEPGAYFVNLQDQTGKTNKQLIIKH